MVVSRARNEATNAPSRPSTCGGQAFDYNTRHLRTRSCEAMIDTSNPTIARACYELGHEAQYEPERCETEWLLADDGGQHSSNAKSSRVEMLADVIESAARRITA